MMDLGEGGDGPEAKRRKAFTKRDRSRPTIVEMERKIKRKKEKVIISTEIESLVESLFLEEGEEWQRLIFSVGILCQDDEI